jgi:predicted transcriptional regulator
VTDLHVQIPDDVAVRLEEAAVARGISPEAVAAEALASFVDTRRALSFAGTLHSGQGDLSERVEGILRSEPTP